MVRQSGTIALALALAWLLVLAEARGAERGFAAADVQSCEQVEQGAVRAEAARGRGVSAHQATAPHAAEASGRIALQRCLRGVQLLI